MSYPVPPTLSVDALQVSRICPDAGCVYARLPGADGAWLSTLVPVRVTVLLFPDVLPAASLARTKYATVAVSGWLSV